MRMRPERPASYLTRSPHGLKRDAMTFSVRILCDNISASRKGYEKDPGFAALLRIEETYLLFDTGMFPDALLNNLEAAGVALSDIQAVLLSHNHNDHTDGLLGLLPEKPDLPVYIHKKWERSISFKGMEIPEKNKVYVHKPGPQKGLPDSVLFTDVFLSRDYGGIFEQAVYLRLRNSCILICGCSHPGLNLFLAQRQQLGIDESNALHVLGGMHGFRFSTRAAQELNPVLESIVCCHCTHYTDVFRKQFGEKCAFGVTGKEYVYE